MSSPDISFSRQGGDPGHYPRRHNSPGFSPLSRFFAHIVSFIFHPLFITSYVIGFLILFHPYAFTGFEPRQKLFKFLNIVLCNAFFPAFSIFLLWRLEFIRSIRLETTRERIIPYVIAMVFYFWTWYVFKNQALENPEISIQFLLGAFLAVCVAWFCNIYFKISMHATAIGGALMFFVLYCVSDQTASGLYLALAVLAAGLVCTARLLLGAHTRFEVYAGLLVGIFTQWVGWQF
jgi:hypothetical protein